MSGWMLLALYVGCYIAVLRGWFLALAGNWQKSFSLNSEDIAGLLAFSAAIAFVWPISGTALAAYVAGRRIITDATGGSVEDSVNKWVRR